MPVKSRLSIHYHTGDGLALCGRAKFQSARSAAAGKIIDPTPRHETNPALVTCKRCLRLMGDYIDETEQEEDF